MIRLLAFALLLACSAPVEAGRIRALFVGIDKYRYSGPTAGFADLRAAVADVARIKAALRTAYALDLDSPSPGRCRSANPVSITLTDFCADRKATLDALDAQIAASAPGDTLVFYFAGHGGEYLDAQNYDQASGFNVTILPADARKPGAESEGDILDRELGAIIDRATAKGINFVSIADSCHSGTLPRGHQPEGEPRGGAPFLINVVRPKAPRPPKRAGPGGYRVHLAAAADTEVAREIVRDDFRGGIFTQALADTLVALPNATFHDIAEEVRLKVIERGHGQQTPQAEGALGASLGGVERRALLLAASVDSKGVAIAAGRLSGITKGSAFALFANTTDALADAARPLATGRISQVDTSRSILTLDTVPVRVLPGQLIARETRHAFGNEELLVRLTSDSEGEKLALAALAGIPFVRVGEPAQVELEMMRDARATLRSVGSDGIGRFEEPRSPGFALWLRESLQKVARVNALLGLRTDPSQASVRFCLAGGDYNVFLCGSPQMPVAPVLVGRPAKMTLVNRSGAPLHIYVFAIDPSFGVTLVMPPNGGNDPPVAANRPVNRVIVPAYVGHYRFVTVATDAPIDAAAFEQSGVASQFQDGCLLSLERARCATASGARIRNPPDVGKWSVVASSVAIDTAR